mgnify:CR=1 FL=1
MYFPYLRGRQNELLCLRELVDKELLSSHIIPIIEPVRYSSTLFSTIDTFNKLGYKAEINNYTASRVN